MARTWWRIVTVPWAEIGTGVAALLVPMLAIANRRLRSIVAEFKPNGGSSIRDSLDRIENAVSENIDRTHALAEGGSRAVWESSLDGQCKRMTSTGLRWLGVQERDLLGNGWVSIIWPEHRAAVREAWASSIADKREFQMDYSWVSSDGKEIPVHAHTYPLRNKKGEITGWVGIVDRR